MLQMVILGVVQGFTEFLPVSSTAHLIFVEAFLGVARPGILLEAVLHLGTALAAVVLFWDDVRQLVAGWLSTFRPEQDHPPLLAYRRLAWLLVLATAITAGIGFTLAAPFERLFGSVRGTAVQLILTGGILLAARERGTRSLIETSAADATAVGIAQAIAIIPGISRSGATIAVAMSMGLRRDEAARLSFLAAIPAVTGAGVFGLKDLHLGAALGYTTAQLVVGFIVSALCGALAIRWLLSVVRRGKLWEFAGYCVVVGVGVLATSARR